MTQLHFLRKKVIVIFSIPSNLTEKDFEVSTKHMEKEVLVPSDNESEDDTKCIRRGVTITVIITAIAGLLIVFLVNPSNSDSTINFIFFNDIHLDLNYDENLSPSDNFCRNQTTINSSTNNSPKQFGQYGCDTPLALFQSMLSYAKSVTKEPSFIVLGGDIVPHNVTLSREENDNLQTTVKNEITKQFPNTPLYMVIGNTDFEKNYGSYEQDAVDFTALSTIYDAFLRENERRTFIKGGYFYKDFPDHSIRILFLNSVIYSLEREFNESRKDPYNQFEFITNASKGAQSQGYSTGIIMHLPPNGNSYLSGSQSSEQNGFHEYYAEQFNKILIDNDIKFVISGHTHLDTLSPTYSNQSDHLYSLGAPSVSPIKGNNPGFRVYSIRSHVIEDYIQYYADIQFNSEKTLNWEQEYIFSRAYSTEDLSNKNIKKAVQWIQNSGSGRWTYRENILARADSLNSFYFCSLNSFSESETQECLQNMNSNFSSKTVKYNFYEDEI